MDLNGKRPIGELWFEPMEKNGRDPALLLKIIFTSQPLSIQVHPDDTFAQSHGLSNGKTEAWYILSAAPGAEVALGPKQPMTLADLRSAIADSSIVDQVQWHPVKAGDVYSVPAGTIHAIGAGIVLVEIQQRSDATFRIFDYGRQRELQIESAVAVANTMPFRPQLPPENICTSRIALVCNEHFVLEKIKLKSGSRWALDVKHETWMFTMDGEANIGGISAVKGGAIFAEAGRAPIDVGSKDLEALFAYPGPDLAAELLEELTDGASVAISSDSWRTATEREPPVSLFERPEVRTWMQSIV